MLVVVDEDVLARLLRVAVDDADPDEVTPPLAPGWAPQRRDWFLAYHRACRAGAAGSAGPGGAGASAGVGGVGGFAGERRERTWAVVVDGEPVGAVRLAVVDPADDGTHLPTDVPLTVETGIWLARSARGGGVGTAALAAVLDRAGALGAGRVVADTAVTNLAAQATVRRLGFTLTPHGDRLRAVIDL